MNRTWRGKRTPRQQILVDKNNVWDLRWLDVSSQFYLSSWRTSGSARDQTVTRESDCRHSCCLDQTPSQHFNNKKLGRKMAQFSPLAVLSWINMLGGHSLNSLFAQFELLISLISFINDTKKKNVSILIPPDIAVSVARWEGLMQAGRRLVS